MNRRDDLAVVGLAGCHGSLLGRKTPLVWLTPAHHGWCRNGGQWPGGRVLSSSVGNQRVCPTGSWHRCQQDGQSNPARRRRTRKMEKLGAAPNRLSQRSTRLPRRILECAPTRCRRRHTTASLRAFSRWAAEPHPLARTSLYERSTGLSTAGWVKPCWRDTPGLPPVRSSAFPTTPSIASDLHQAAVLDRINEPESCSIPKQRRVAVTAMVGDTWLRAVESSVPSLRWYPARTLTEWLTRGADLWGHLTARKERRAYSPKGPVTWPGRASHRQASAGPPPLPEQAVIRP